MNSPDPVQSGLVASLARPGRNIPGLTTLSADLSNLVGERATAARAESRLRASVRGGACSVHEKAPVAWRSGLCRLKGSALRFAPPECATRGDGVGASR